MKKFDPGPDLEDFQLNSDSDALFGFKAYNRVALLLLGKKFKFQAQFDDKEWVF